MTNTQRDIAVVMFTDMRGFTALMQSDEELTLQLLDLQRRLAEPLLEKHRGRLIKTIGDAFMVEFRSAVDAVRCAVALQQALHEYNATVPSGRGLHIRIGVHMGDVLRSGDDLLGDTVNIAARVEARADPDGVSMTRAVYEQVRTKIEYTIESQGMAQLAGVAGDTPLYRVLLPWSAPGTASPRAESASRKRGWMLAGAALAAVAIAGGIAVTVWNTRAPPPAPAAQRAPTPAPVYDRKSVAVLPFENLSGRAEDAYLADGLQEEVLSAVARLRNLKVISRTSVMEFRGTARNVREIGQRLGVGTILEGSVRRDGNKLRLNVQLIDANDDRHLLAASYDRNMSHLLDLQSAVARQVADTLSATLTREERGELGRVGTNNGDAYDRYLRAIALVRGTRSVDKWDEARRLLQEALKLDPDYAEAHAQLSRMNAAIYYLGGHNPKDAAGARQAYERALAIDPQLPEALLARANYATFVALDPDQALPDLEAVVRSRPSSADAHEMLGYALRRLGRMEAALEHFSRAWDLDPLNVEYSWEPFFTLLGLRRWPEAIAQADLQIKRFPGDAERRMARARFESLARNDIEPMRAALREVGGQLNAQFRSTLESEIAIAEGRYRDAIPLVDTGLPWLGPFERKTYVGMLYHAAGDERRASDAVRSAMNEWRGRSGRKSEDGPDPEFLAIAQSMLGEHAAALATIDEARANLPESRDAFNAPELSFTRSVILVRAGRSEEGYAEVTRLLRVPFGSPRWKFASVWGGQLLVKDDPHYKELLTHPPRL